MKASMTGSDTPMTGEGSDLSQLAKICSDDMAALKKAALSYGDSWKKRGGVGAFMMLARKWDRIENQVQLLRAGGEPPREASPYDIFEHIKLDPRPEGLIDDIQDLRRYLLLVEAHLRAIGHIK